MDKDNLGRSAGFTKILGGEDLPINNDVNGWGVSDKNLIDSTITAWKQAKSSDNPIFLSILNVGTHQPYLGVDFNALPSFGNQYEAAFYNFDQLIKTFFSFLQKEGDLDNTLIVITSDESGAHSYNIQKPKSQLAANHGLAIIVSPNNKKFVHNYMFTQADLQFTIMDYLGLPNAKKDLQKSLLRTYNHFRPVSFSNLYMRTSYHIPSPGILLSCHYNMQSCHKHKYQGRLFDDKTIFKSNGLTPNEKNLFFPKYCKI